MPNDSLRPFVLGLVPAGAAAAARPQGRPAKARGQAGFNVRDHGAAGDGIRLDTRAIQDTIDGCAGAGGGTVLVPAGAYLS
jgi:polygalacturonase